MAGQVAQVQADLLAAQTAAGAAARELEAARADDRDAKRVIIVCRLNNSQLDLKCMTPGRAASHCFQGF